MPRPAAGAECIVTVPGGALWRIISVRFELTTSAAVADRVTEVSIDDGTTELWRITLGPAQSAGLVRQFLLAPFLGFATVAFTGTGIYWPIPEGPFPSGYRIRTVTAGLQAADQYSAPVVYVYEVGLRGLASEIAYEVHNLIRENVELSAIEREGFS